jgi:hypothetical protein
METGRWMCFDYICTCVSYVYFISYGSDQSDIVVKSL